MVADLRESLERKVGPFPVWVYGGVGAAAIFLLYLRKRKSSSGGTGGNPLYGANGSYLGSGGGGGLGGDILGGAGSGQTTGAGDTNQPGGGSPVTVPIASPVGPAIAAQANLPALSPSAPGFPGIPIGSTVTNYPGQPAGTPVLGTVTGPQIVNQNPWAFQVSPGVFVPPGIAGAVPVTIPIGGGPPAAAAAVQAR